MVRAYVLMEVEQGKVQKVLNKLTNMPEVREFDAITGNFDVIVHIEGVDQNELGKLSASKLAMLEGVRRTITYNVVEF
jgi:DNA-binding Lrp family transcriptional regulator